MRRFRLLSAFLLTFFWTSIQATAASVDPNTLLAQAIVAVTGGKSVSDVTLSGAAVWMLGSDQESGTGTLKAKGVAEGRADVTLTKQTRSEIRNDTSTVPDGEWIGTDGVAHHMALHNCWVPGGWFSPPAILAWSIQTGAVPTYVGSETRNGVLVDHVRIARTVSGQGPDETSLIKLLTTIDLYLDATSHLPFSLVFNTHPDNDASRNIPVEIRFADYRASSGVNLPFRIQRLFQGNLNLDVTVSTAAVNSGLPDSDFTLQ